MKNYLIFLISFLCLYVAFQLLSGVILTWIYTPNFSSGAFPQTVEFGETSKWSLLIMMMAASIAFFVSMKFQKN